MQSREAVLRGSADPDASNFSPVTKADELGISPVMHVEAERLRAQNPKITDPSVIREMLRQNDQVNYAELLAKTTDFRHLSPEQQRRYLSILNTPEFRNTVDTRLRGILQMPEVTNDPNALRANLNATMWDLIKTAEEQTDDPAVRSALAGFVIRRALTSATHSGEGKTYWGAFWNKLMQSWVT